MLISLSALIISASWSYIEFFLLSIILFGGFTLLFFLSLLFSLKYMPVICKAIGPIIGSGDHLSNWIVSDLILQKKKLRSTKDLADDKLWNFRLTQSSTKNLPFRLPAPKNLRSNCVPSFLFKFDELSWISGKGCHKFSL